MPSLLCAGAVTWLCLRNLRSSSRLYLSMSSVNSLKSINPLPRKEQELYDVTFDWMQSFKMRYIICCSNSWSLTLDYYSDVPIYIYMYWMQSNTSFVMGIQNTCISTCPIFLNVFKTFYDSVLTWMQKVHGHTHSATWRSFIGMCSVNCQADIPVQYSLDWSITAKSPLARKREPWLA